MEKSVFKKGDKVFDYRNGWGIVMSVSSYRYAIDVNFFNGNGDCYTYDGRTYAGNPKTLSFTEYTLEGFSQKPSKESAKKGQIVWGRDNFNSEWMIGYFIIKKGDTYIINAKPNATGRKYEVNEITTENPYKDE
jgi:hypothetical protein